MFLCVCVELVTRKTPSFMLEGGKSVIRYPNGKIGLIEFPMYRLEGGKSVIRYPNEIIGFD